MNNKLLEKVKRISLNATFIILQFFVLLSTAALCFVCMVLASRLSLVIHNSAPRVQWLFFAIISVMVGTILSAVFMRRPLRPFSQLLDALIRISKGDYSVRLNLRGAHMIRELNQNFNHMASELASIEMLRTDFINNFSHEFKTPIVSISGFAKMLKRDNLTAEERAEYLDIIITESDRLTTLANNVLSLSKIENQHILTDTKIVNISEQIRLAVAMLAQKWEDKRIDIRFDAEEMYLCGNEDMLKQIWLNLVDNAIKFSPEYGTVHIDARQQAMGMVVSVMNEGELPEDVLAHIFDKFYQGNTSHTEQGNGLGLTIAKKITELHGGTLQVANKGDGHIALMAGFPTAKAD